VSEPFVHKIAWTERQRIDTFHSVGVDSIVSNRLTDSVNAADRELDEDIVPRDTPLNWWVIREKRPLGSFDQWRGVRIGS